MKFLNEEQIAVISMSTVRKPGNFLSKPGLSLSKLLFYFFYCSIKIYAVCPKISKLLSGSSNANSLCPQGLVCNVPFGHMLTFLSNID